MALDLDGTEYRFGEATISGDPFGPVYNWSEPLPTWAEGQTVSVQLISRLPDAPGNVAATGADASATLTWTDPINGGTAATTKFQYRYATGGRTPAADAAWTDVPDSNVGEANRHSFTLPSLTNDVVHPFELRAVSAAGPSESVRVQANPRGSTPVHGSSTTVLSNLGRSTLSAALTIAASVTITRDANRKITAYTVDTMGYRYAQTFSTGSDGHLFELDSVDIRFKSDSADANDDDYTAHLGDVMQVTLVE